MTVNARRTGISASLRLSLMGSTALIGSALLAGQAQAQTVPSVANAGGASIGTTTAPGGAVTMNVNLNDASRIIDFNTYNVGTSDTVNYSTTTAGLTDLVAVNRVLTGGGISFIDGTINAADGISVWLVNQDGISFSSSSSVNLSGGSLMLSTLDFADTVDGPFRTAFAAAGAANATSFRFASGASSTSQILIGGNLNVAGSIVAVAPRIAADSTIDASAGSVVLVAATDVTFTSGLSNPLQFTVGAGTTLSDAVSVGGDVSGQSVLVAGGVQNSLTAALLNVRASGSLTATASGGTVTLATTTTTVDGNTATITNGAGAAGSIAVNGAISGVGPGTNADIVVNSAQDVTGTGTITTPGGNLAVTAARDITVAGSDYTAGMNASFTAGRDATLGRVSTGGDVATSAGRDATFSGIVTSGGEFSVQSIRDTAINAAIGAGGDVSLVVLGDTSITDNIGSGGAYSLTRTINLTQSGDVIAAGNVDIAVVQDALVTGRNQSSGGDLTIDVGGDATLGALTAANTASVVSGGFTHVDGAVDAGDFTVTAGGDIGFSASIDSDTDVSLSAGGDTLIEGTVNAGRDFLVTQTQGYTQDGNVFAGRDVSLTISGNANAGGSIEATGGAVTIDVDGTADFGAISALGDIIADVGLDARFIGSLTAGGDVDLFSGGTLAVRGDVDAGDDYLLEADAIEVGLAGVPVTQQAARRVFFHAASGDITGFDGLSLQSDADGTGLANLELQADNGTVAFAPGTTLVAGLAAGLPTQRSDVVVTSAPTISLGDVTGASLYTSGDSALTATGDITTGALTLDNGLTINSTAGSVTTGAIGLLGADQALEIYAGGASGDVTTGNLSTNHGDIFVSAVRNLSVGGASTARVEGAPGLGVAGDVALYAGGSIQAGAIVAGEDFAALAGGNLTVASATVGDDIDLLSTGGNVSLGNGQSFATGDLGTSIAFGATPGQPGSIGAALTLPGTSTISLRSQTGDAGSATQLVTANGDVIVNAARDVSLASATATGGAVAVRAGRDVTQTGTLTSTTEDVAIGAGRNASLGAVIAADDIDISAPGTLTWTSLQTTNAASGSSRFVDVTSNGAGASDGVTFGGADALSGGSFVRIRAGDVGGSAAGPVGLIAGTVTTNNFIGSGASFTAAAGDIRLGTVTSHTDIYVNSANGSVTGLPDGYTAVSGGTIDGGTGGAVLLDITGSGVIGAITAGSVTTAGNADTLRIQSIDANLVDLNAVTTLDVGTITARSVDLSTTGGAPAPGANLEITGTDTLLAEGYGAANLFADEFEAYIGVHAANGIAQLGQVRAGDSGYIFGNEITISARAISATSVDANDGSLSMTASDGLLALGSGSAQKYIDIVKRNDDGVSAGSGTTTDIVDVGTLNAGWAINVSSATSARIASATAGGNDSLARDIRVSAAQDIVIAAADARYGTVALHAGGGITGGSLIARNGDVVALAAGDIAITAATANDDIELTSTGGDITLTDGTAGFVGGTGTGDDWTAFTGTPGNVSSITVNHYDTDPNRGNTILLRAESGDITSSGLLQTLSPGNVLANASGDIALSSVNARNSIGLLAGGTIDALSLVAGIDVFAQGGGDVTIGAANANDDIDVLSLAGDVSLTNGISLGSSGGTSVTVTGAAGSLGAIATGLGEEDQLTGSTIRLTAAAGDVTSTGTLETQGTGDIFANAAGDASLNVATAARGSVGMLAGGLASANSLTASIDIGVQGGTGISVGTADAGDDVDMISVTGDVSLGSGSSSGAGSNLTSVLFGTAGVLGDVEVGAQNPQLGNATIRLRAIAGDVVSTGTLRTSGRGEIYVNAFGDADLATLDVRNGSIGVLSGTATSATSLTASRDVTVRGGTGVTVGSARAGDDIDMVAVTGDVSLVSGVSTGLGTGGTSITFTGAPGTDAALGVAAGEDSELANASIRLRAATGDVVSSGTLRTEGTGDVLVNAANNATLALAEALGGSIGVLAGRDVSAGTLTANVDLGVLAGRDAFLTTATAGDDIDVVAGRDLGLVTGSSLATAGTGGTSVAFGTVGAANAVTIAGTEDGQLTAATIRLRAANGSIAGTFTPALGTTLTTAGGDILLNAATDVNVLDADAVGSIGALAGGQVTAATLTASRDIGVQGGTGVTIATANAGDDIDAAALTGTLTLTDGTATGTGSGATSVLFTGTAGTAGAVGTGAEDAQLGGSSIRLRAASGDIASTGTLHTQGTGEVLVNASGSASLATATADGGSIGVLAGGQVTAATLTASRDIGVQGGTGVTITTATAGDDIDAAALTGTLTLTDGTATGAGSGGTSVLFTGTAGTAAALGTGAEDAQLGGSSIRLRAASGDIASTGTLHTQGTGEVLVNASGNASLATVTADGGSIGVLAGGQVTAATLTASRDIGVQGGTGVTIATANAGDDIDAAALTGTLTLTNGTATGTGSGGTSVLFTGTAGTAAAVGTGAEDAQLGGSSIRLRAASGDITSTGTLHTQGTGEVLVNASGNASLATVTASGGSIGVLAGGQVTAATLTASRDIGVQGGTGVAITTATAGDDIDAAALAGNLSLTNGTATGAGANGSGVVVSAAAGTAAAVGIGTEDTQLTAPTIRLRAQAGNVTSTGALLSQGNVLVNAAQALSLNTATATTGSVGALAGTTVNAASLVAGRDIGVQGGTGVTVGSATAGDDIDVTALTGNLALTNGTSTGAAGAGGTGVTFTGTPGTLAAVGIGSENTQLAGASIRLRAATGSVTSTGTLRTQGTGDVLVNARGGVQLATTSAAAGSVALLAGGNVTAGTTSASEDVAVLAGGDASLTTTSAGDDIEVAAIGLVTLGTATITSGGTGLDARHAVLSTALAGTVNGIGLAAGDPRGTKSLPAGSSLANEANGRNIIVEASDVALNGTLTAGSGRAILRNTGTRATVVGDQTSTAGSTFAVSNAELGFLNADTVVVDSGANALELATLTVAADTGRSATRFLGTGAVAITGPITVAGTTRRTLQIGGLLGDLGNDAGAETLATSIVAQLDGEHAPKIIAGSADVELRGEKILFGTEAMIADFINLDNDEIAKQVSNPASKLYRDPTAINVGVFLTAKSVTVGYKNFALFQNTQISANQGVSINSVTGGAPEQTTLALRLISTGDEGNNAFAMFGVVNNFSDTTAALLTNEAIQIVNPTGNSDDVRITRSNSRINGCVIGAPDRGCLATDVPQPNFNFYDERKIALFDTEEDTTIAISPLIGRGNDGLIVNVADAPVGIDTLECRPDDPQCTTKEGK
ncbi:filamentous hemagglutinin N-terminal domain-containing protein [Novosphingobium resinovorum]|uniref:filamentous hemagglutinin N-terminal domain-containing protein n=1 Tax=Novosphingobium resinovorum TaxID=158500 RepID=UPI002ED148EB|nr:filamentous hemagglutinin N-terminal domain-containing protein [Novosphingobium resinovorum]